MRVIPHLWRSRTVTFSWYGFNLHSVRFERSGASPLILLLPSRQIALKGVANVVQEWLVRIGASAIAWHDRWTLAAGADGRATPF